ncbi:hypothetical protein GH714_014807 [Hevea brasiliensis]|uniref:Zinc finger PMZ-type domain-containing protein n=1 Tax=Hevea brasiliensis TaxID=3981 RepID=A0A6A6NH60_HEVBR|nr:hypothetical protein GH714_014807 [Hevea brasiliensis]
MNEDTITNNDCLHTSANGDDIGEDIIRHDNESQMPNAKDDGIGQTVGNRSEVESQHDADVRNDNESQMPNVEDDGIEQAFGNRSEVESAHELDVREAIIPRVDLVDEDYDMVSGDEHVATIFNDIDKGNIGGRPKENDMKDPTFQIGMLFKNIDEFKEACRAYGIKHRFQIHFPRNEVRADPEWSINGLINRVKNDLIFTIGKIKAWRARDWALKTLNRDEKDQYAKLYRYKEELIRTNPGTTVEFQTEKGKFEGIYICLATLKNAFNEGLRKLICLDGYWLKGTYGGQLLSTVAIDPNDCIFHLAYAVGFTGAVSELFPNAEHRFCVRHLYTNFRGRFKGKELKDLLWNIARSAYIARMDYWLGKMEDKNPEAREWLRNRPCENWSTALFRTEACCDILTKNLYECFNKYILDARDKPIISLLEMIRSKLMKWLFKKKEYIKKWNGGICPKIQKKLNEMKELSCLFEAHFSRGPNVQVLGAGTQYVVSLVERTCTCRRWDLNGIPSVHACSVIFGNNEHPEDYIHECYKVDAYAKVYAHYINPSNGYEMWPRPSIRYSFTHPDPIEKKRGRKRKARKKKAEELEHAQARGKLSKKCVVSIRCSICGQIGHNKRHHEVDRNISTPTTKGKRATSGETYEGNTRITT